MKAAVWYGCKEIRIEEVPKPDPGPNDVLVRVKAAGICGSDLHAYEGISKRRVPPLIMGHEIAGEIAEIGGHVEGSQIGDRVVIQPVLSCGECEQCRSGNENVCRNIRFLGLHVSGGFAEYVMAPARNCYTMPSRLRFEEACLAEPLSVAVHVVNNVPVGVNGTILIVGAGVVGSMVTQVARLRTSGKIIVTDILDSRLDLAKKLGADIMINPQKKNVAEEIHRITGGRGVDVSIEVVGIESTVQDALASVKKGGTTIAIGLLEKSMKIDVMRLVSSELKLLGSYLYNDCDFRSSINLIAEGKVNLQPYLTRILALDDALKGFGEMATNKEKILKVILRPY
ncbi:MAG: alcohol dehydrogenase catalytic domain-containing protein [Candidatus Bathyarchaeota archaeon]|nr:alcohol dehydrogenase catalytic domain-containing protein [Candidatus Bathyarchaeota archaeon]MDH5687201.1 alcohol dehydrogenase catalytic domain-containing protein [Candidatus Bathyarchaeota archaeon]